MSNWAWPGFTKHEGQALDVLVGALYDVTLLDDPIIAQVWTRILARNPLLAFYVVPATVQGAA